MAGLDFDSKMNKEIVGASNLPLILPEKEVCVESLPL